MMYLSAYDDLFGAASLIFEYNCQLTTKQTENKMGNTQFAIPHNLSHEWMEIIQSGQKLIHNRITQQNFILHKVSKNEGIDTKSYIQRSIYPIPHSPKLIIIDDTPSFFYFLVQNPSTSFRYLIKRKHLLVQILTVLKDLAMIAYQLKQKYGNFQIRESMIGVLKNEQVMLWIHQDNHSNERQFPLIHQDKQESQMIKALIKICQQHSKFDLNFVIKQFAGVLNFKQFIKHLIVKIEVEKFKLSQKNIYIAQTQNDLKAIRNKEHAEPFRKQLNRTNTNLKNFDKALIAPITSIFRHRRNYTYTDFQNNNQRSRSKGFTPEKQMPFKQSNINPNSTEVNNLTFQNKKPVQKHQPYFNSLGYSQINSSKAIYLRGTTGSAPFSEISFSKKLNPKEKAKPVLERVLGNNKEQNIATRSSEQGVQGQFEQRQERRVSTIRWVEDDIGLCEKSIEQDYQCLFTRPGRTLSKRFKLLNRVEEQLNIHLDEDSK